MFENRISTLFPPIIPAGHGLESHVASSAQLFPTMTLEEIYQAAFTRARNDCELDRLFNPEYYGDHGSGI